VFQIDDRGAVDSEVLHVFTMNSGLMAAWTLGMKPSEPLVRPPLSHVDPNRRFAVEFENGNQP
jgi:hypothetical protein